MDAALIPRGFGVLEHIGSSSHLFSLSGRRNISLTPGYFQGEENFMFRLKMAGAAVACVAVAAGAIIVGVADANGVAIVPSRGEDQN